MRKTTIYEWEEGDRVRDANCESHEVLGTVVAWPNDNTHLPVQFGTRGKMLVHACKTSNLVPVVWDNDTTVLASDAEFLVPAKRPARSVGKSTWRGSADE